MSYNYANYISRWVERLERFRCRKALRGTSKGSESSAKRKDGASLKEGPYPRREGTKASYKTIGSESSQDCKQL